MTGSMDLLKQFDLGYEGFAKANAETMEALAKALQAGSGTDAASFTGGRALTPESLDTTLVNVLHSTDEARLFQRLKKTPVKSVVHQWDIRTEVGTDDGLWVSEGGTGTQTDQTITRKVITASYLQVMRQVTLQAASSGMIEDAMAIEAEAGALQLIRVIETYLFKGSTTMVPQWPNGLDAQITAANGSTILDLRGKDATSASYEQALNDAARSVRGNFGVPTHAFSSIFVMEDTQALLRDRLRWGPGYAEQGGTGVFNKYPTPYGTMELIDDVFIKEGGAPTPSAVTGYPSAGLAYTLARANSPSTSQFGASDAGNYDYKIAPVNQYGEGAAVEVALTGILAADRVTASISAYPSPNAATAFRVYRSKVGGTTGAVCLYAFIIDYNTVHVTNSDKIYDDNLYLPGTSTVYILNLNPAYNALEWAQFLPMMKFDLYPTSSAVYPFLMLLFGALAVKKPQQMVRIINVSPSNLGWF